MAEGALTELTLSLAALLIMAGGFCVMIQQKHWAGRFFSGGVALAVVSALLPDISRVSQGVPVVPWQWSLAFLAIVFAVLRQFGIAAVLAAPLAYSLIVWPVVSTLPVALAVIVVVLLIVSATARLLNALFGPEVAGHVVGTYIVRLIDGLFTRRARGDRQDTVNDPPTHHDDPKIQGRDFGRS